MKLSVKSTVIIIGFALIGGCRPGNTENVEDKRVPVTLATALKLGPDKLTKVIDEHQSEAGKDWAAKLYATAKRIETEHALAQRDLELVLQLNVWREALADCRVGSCNLARTYFSGGTMYGHGARRDCAALEDFLAGLAKRLPLAEGKGSTKAAKQIDDAIAYIKNLDPAHGEDSESIERAKVRLPAEVEGVTEYWDHLKDLIKDIPEAEANKIADFAVKSLRWLKDEFP
jgi:hypothetical protein